MQIAASQVELNAELLEPTYHPLLTESNHHQLGAKPRQSVGGPESHPGVAIVCLAQQQKLSPPRPEACAQSWGWLRLPEQECQLDTHMAIGVHFAEATRLHH